jgi:hypothetical protein
LLGFGCPVVERFLKASLLALLLAAFPNGCASTDSQALGNDEPPAAQGQAATRKIVQGVDICRVCRGQSAQAETSYLRIVGDDVRMCECEDFLLIVENRLRGWFVQFESSTHLL